MNSRARLLFVDNIAVEAARRAFYREVAKLGDFEVHLLVPAAWREQGGVTAAESEPDPRLHLHVSPILFGYRQHRVIHTKLLRLLRDLRPELLYVDSEPENYTAAFARWAVDRASPSTKLALVSSRNLDYTTIGFPYKAAWTHRWCDSGFLRRPADQVFSRPVAGIKLLGSYAAQVHHLPHSVDCTLFHPRDVTPSGGDAADITLGYVGRLVESKGLRLLVDVIPALPPTCRLRLVGKGPLRGELERQAGKLDVAARVRIQEPVPYRSVPDVLRAVDILVVPSQESAFWVEQFGRVIIEAMACGVPVVASRSGEIPETLGDAGLLVPPGDRQALIQAVHALAANATRRTEIGSVGRSRALNKYDAPVVAASFLRAIRPLLS